MYAQPPDAMPEGILETIDLGGRLVLPGLMDAHIHVGYTGECAEYAQLTGECRVGLDKHSLILSSLGCLPRRAVLVHHFTHHESHIITRA